MGHVGFALHGELPHGDVQWQVDRHAWSSRETWARETLEGWPELKGQRQRV